MRCLLCSLILLLAAGCAETKVDQHTYACTADKQCGAGWCCASGVCVSSSGGRCTDTGGADTAGGVDVPRDLGLGADTIGDAGVEVAAEVDSDDDGLLADSVDVPGPGDVTEVAEASPSEVVVGLDVSDGDGAVGPDAPVLLAPTTVQPSVVVGVATGTVGAVTLVLRPLHTLVQGSATGTVNATKLQLIPTGAGR